MKTTVSKSDFRDAFSRMGRQGNFSFAGLDALYDFIEEVAPDSELDVIAYCCEFTEYENIEEFHGDYDAEDYPNIESIENATTVIRIDDDAFIIQAF